MISFFSLKAQRWFTNGTVVAKQKVRVVIGENALGLNGIVNLSDGYTIQLMTNNMSYHTRLFIQK